MLKGSTIHFYCLFDEPLFSNMCTYLDTIIECRELNGLCKHMKKVRSSQAAILILNLVKHSFSLWVLLKKVFLKFILCSRSYLGIQHNIRLHPITLLKPNNSMHLFKILNHALSLIQVLDVHYKRLFILKVWY